METKTTQCHPRPAVNATCLLGEKGCFENGKCHYMGNCEHKVLTNADRIRAMSDEELAEFIRSMVDDDCGHEVACYGCVNYGTHHSDPVNKGTHLYECDGCSCEGIGLDVLKWLQKPVEVADNDA